MRNSKIEETDIAKFQALVKEFTTVLKSELPKLKSVQKEENYTDTCLYNYLERFLFAWLSIEKLLPLLLKSPGFNYPVGIIARSIIIDCITTIYLCSKIKINEHGRDEKVFLQECKKLDFDFFSAKYSLLLGLKLNENEFQQILKDNHEGIKHIYPKFFPIVNGKYTLANMEGLPIKKMGHPDKTKPYHKSYWLYRMYSQYEHCSFFTKDMQNNFNRSNFNMLVDTFNYTTIASEAMFKIINLKDAEIKSDEIYHKVNKLLDELFPQSE